MSYSVEQVLGAQNLIGLIQSVKSGIPLIPGTEGFFLCDQLSRCHQRLRDLSQSERVSTAGTNSRIRRGIEAGSAAGCV